MGLIYKMMTKENEKWLFWQKSADLVILKNILRTNRVAISSTDTIPGFLSNVSSQSSNLMREFKEIQYKRPFLILIASAEKLQNFVDIELLPERILRFLSRCWPGPVTVIFKAKPGLPSHLLSPEGTIALRAPAHEGLQEILPEFDGLFSTSANKAQEPAPQSIAQISPELLEKVACVVVDEHREKIVSDKPSSIIDFSQIDFSQEGASGLPYVALPFKVVREGLYSIEKLKEIYAKTK